MNPYTGDEELDSIVREKVMALPAPLKRVLDDGATEIYIRTFSAKAGLSEEQTDKLVSEVVMLILGVTPLTDFSLILMTELDMTPRLAFAVEGWVTGTLLHDVTSLLGGNTVQEEGGQDTPMPEETTPLTPTAPSMHVAPAPEIQAPTPLPIPEVSAPIPIPTSAPREPQFRPPVPSIHSAPASVHTEVFIKRPEAVPTPETPAPVAVAVPAPAPEPVFTPAPTVVAPQVPAAPRLTVSHQAVPIQTTYPVQSVATPPPIVITPTPIHIPTIVIPPIQIPTIAPAPQIITPTLQKTEKQPVRIYTILSDIERFRAGMTTGDTPRYAKPLTDTPKY